MRGAAAMQRHGKPPLPALNRSSRIAAQPKRAQYIPRGATPGERLVKSWSRVDESLSVHDGTAAASYVFDSLANGCCTGRTPPLLRRVQAALSQYSMKDYQVPSVRSRPVSVVGMRNLDPSHRKIPKARLLRVDAVCPEIRCSSVPPEAAERTFKVTRRLDPCTIDGGSDLKRIAEYIPEDTVASCSRLEGDSTDDAVPRGLRQENLSTDEVVVAAVVTAQPDERRLLQQSLERVPSKSSNASRASQASGNEDAYSGVGSEDRDTVNGELDFSRQSSVRTESGFVTQTSAQSEEEPQTYTAEERSWNELLRKKTAATVLQTATATQRMCLAGATAAVMRIQRKKRAKLKLKRDDANQLSKSCWTPIDRHDHLARSTTIESKDMLFDEDERDMGVSAENEEVGKIQDFAEDELEDVPGIRHDLTVLQAEHLAVTHNLLKHDVMDAWTLFKQYDDKNRGVIPRMEFIMMLRKALKHNYPNVKDVPRDLLKRELNSSRREWTFLDLLTWLGETAFNKHILFDSSQKRLRDLSKELGLPLNEVEEFKTQFDRVDLDGSGSISFPEFKLFLNQLLLGAHADRACLTDRRLLTFWAQITGGGDGGVVGFDQFIQWYLKVFARSSVLSPLEVFYRSVRPFPEVGLSLRS